ncbi:putative F-box domain, leucine-rich repeat domain, L domain-containing protein [Medicago truncatula]|uniref:F-box/RNI/FBD-like domain protein n=1 Tax=Medicago truncatula TaxID=3880 RepID=G7IVC7_MEDTR|nr:F-box/RNI/FBD-like domain protein [Medicago truncatula]RHN65331.1 putative F-box domain, leucine-rich repeat domain, L domain-containing protein [Medicago truncatula]
MEETQRQIEEDRMSELSDNLLHHILSFLNAKEAVQTCILSKRWINLWKTLSTLTLSVDHFSTEESFEQFISMLLSLRDHSTDIHSLVFHFQWTHVLSRDLYLKTIEYAFSHNVQHFQILYTAVKHLPSCFFSSHTLTSLNLTGKDLMVPSGWYQIFPSSHSFNLPALTTLYLKHLSFSCNDDDDGSVVDPFSTFNMLNTLIIDRCVLRGNAQNLRISCTKLLNLTIRMYGCYSTITKPDFKIFFGLELYAPTLHSFVFNGADYIPKFVGSKTKTKTVLSSIKHLTIHLKYCSCFEENPVNLFNLLVELANIESLTITHCVLKVLSRFHSLFEVEFPSLCYLKSLNVRAFRSSWIIAEMVDFLLQNSPSAKFRFIER